MSNFAMAAFSLGADAFVQTPTGSHAAGPHVVVRSSMEAQRAPSTSAQASQFSTIGTVGVVATGALLMSAVSKKSHTRSALDHRFHNVTLHAFESELGVQAPVGFWDPVGFTADGDVAAFKRRRSVEIKHGRICMMATMGYITPEVIGKLPGFLSPSAGLKFADIPNGLAAISKVPTAGWAQIAAYFGFVEFSGGFEDYKSGTPGDYGFKVLTSADPEEKTKKLNAEIANGRLAMMAIIGMFFQDGLTGSAWGDWALYTASPLRAFESELGVQAPVGFWDPVGFTADGDVAAFKRRRSVEIKHGRICMMATMGYITPEVTGKLPGFLSPSAGLKFADIPNGLAAISKVPTAGWAQIAAYFGFVEFSGGFEDYKSGTPGDYGFKVLTSADPEEKTKKLNAEIANGRLAMMAIIGMFFQDGLTGSAWGDWALYTASPLRAFESELGVQPPLGLWDPAGYLDGASELEFKRLRSCEIKHGRLAMMATIGFIFPFYSKLPGYLSPSQNVKFDDIPVGITAVEKIPSAGWVQILLFAALCEFGQPKGIEEWKVGEPGDYGRGFLGMFGPIMDPEKKKRSLNAEIANGRLAMAAITGMVLQNGATGTTGPEMWFGSAAFENEIGAQAPLGFWDPLGYTADGNVENFARRRQSEIKHGRIAMLATMGYITPELTGKFDGYLSPSAGCKFADVPNGLAAISKVPGAGWVQIGAWMAMCEISQDQGPGTPGAKGDLGWKVLTSSDPATRDKKLASELANGRLAMMAIIGMFFQDGLTGSAWGDWANYTDSPLRAFENELGVQAPFGFWDPLGLSKDGDVDAFKRRRSSEIKHGRIAMLATMGYITPEIAGKFPGYLDPVSGLKFADIPNGLAAIGQVPFGGWAQMIAYGGFVEWSAGFGKDVSENPGDMGFKPPLLATDDAELKKRRLNSELANGRLAMMAIIGMFFQDGLTGSAWGDWANYTDSPLRAFENELGVQAPLGFWDPLGISKDGNVAAFKRRRSVEIKHGRISMLATMGYITPELTGKFPGPLAPGSGLKFADVPNGLAALSKVPFGGWLQIIAYCGFVEAKSGYDADITDRTPGDMGWKPPLLTSVDPEVKKRRLNAELANGRLSMMAIIGMFFQDGLTGSAWGDWANYTDSPLRAFENELGVQAPVGFWDPVGFTADGDVAAFKRRRSVEIKHGRICMMATMGYITPEVTGKLPGFLSPSAGLKFADIPNGLAAISKVPTAGWAQIAAYFGFVEFSGGFEDYKSGTPGDYGFKVLTSADPEEKTKKLNAEIANGRLAMMAIIGMFFQDGLTGSAWGDWALYTASPLRAVRCDSTEQWPWGPLKLSMTVGMFVAATYGQPALAADIENGQQVFGANCAACHAGGNNTVVPEKKLKKEALQQYGKYEVSQIITQVTNGNGAMPAFGERLAPDDIEDVANYVRAQADKGW